MQNGLNARQEQFCKLFVACGLASQAYRDAGYKSNGRSTDVAGARLLNVVAVRERIAQLQAQKDARMSRKDITKEALVERMWEIVHDSEAKRGEAIQAGIAVAKMVGWNAPTRVEHDLGDKVRAYLEDIRSRPLRPVMTNRYDSRLMDRVEDSQVIDVQPDSP